MSRFMCGLAGRVPGGLKICRALLALAVLVAGGHWGGGLGGNGAVSGLWAAQAWAGEGAALAFPRGHLHILTRTGQHRFSLEIAETPATRARGLMFRERLAADHGMLFDFGQEQRAAMWMKNTPLSLDMIFAAGDGRVLGVAENAVPFSLTPIEAPGRPRYVLEVVAGTVERLGIQAGDRLQIGARP